MKPTVVIIIIIIDIAITSQAQNGKGSKEIFIIRKLKKCIKSY